MNIGTQSTLGTKDKNQITSGNFRHLRILLLPIILTAGLCGGMALFILDAYQGFKKIGTEDIAIIDLSNQIIYLDEVLTSSARLAASTGNESWEKRYNDSIPKLDEVLAETAKLLPLIDSSGITNTDEANDKLVAMETQAFKLTNQGKLSEATALLSSLEYEKQKSVYAQGITETTAALQQYVENNIKKKSQLTYSMLVVIGIASAVLLIAWTFVLQRMRGYIQAINNIETVISNTSLKIASAVERQEKIANEQASSVSQTTSTVDLLGETSRRSAVQAEESAKSANMALSLAETGAQTVDQTRAGMESLKERVREIAEQIINLSEQTEQIAGVSELVGDLANQTNMLALNAAVEAARAGEYGKGFGVVAGEIRKLADQSRKSADKINNLVTDVQAAMNSAVMVTDEGKKTAESSIELALGTAESFIGVKEAVNSVFANTSEISSTAKEQAVGIQEILAAVNALNLGAMDTAADMENVKASTIQLKKFTEELKAIV
ncbi:methyl-accepting chemotaxis protein [Pleurocapsa sp. FMAR1]|uniref:methyl-accepting chemotaxis protein n=1 Tax=Pleurocapsa sp. FMAR1 TaxID=3040204 RepID=UPI0029C9B049|nr:methyl-accepting chemotaxis protein [Pleurocapsa sp. FMAR1]